FAYALRAEREGEPFANGVLIRPEATRHGFADDHHRGSAASICIAEAASATHRNLHGTEIAGRNHTHGNFRLVSHGHHWPAFDLDRLRRPALQRQTISHASVFNPWQRAHAAQHF